MFKTWTAAFALFGALAFATTHTVADDSKGDTKADNKLIGTWKLVSAKYGGRDNDLPRDLTTVKHITPTQYTWASYGEDGVITRLGGGPCTVKGDKMESTPEYGIGDDFEAIRGKHQSYNVKVNGNKFHQSGTLSTGAALDEVWERVDAAGKSELKADNPLIATWKRVSGKYGGQESKFPEGWTMLKHVTPSHFMWVTYDAEGKVSRAAGGPCSLKGDAYEETPAYGISSDFALIKGNTHAFKWKIEGNRAEQTGALATGLTIEETWERVDKK